MADNIAITPGTGASVSTDEVTTLNGGTVSAVQVQRVKPVYGLDGTATDVSSTNGLPIQGITAASSSTSWTSATSVNTANTISVGGMNAVSVTLIPTTTFTGGVLTFEVSPDNTNWVPISMARIDTFTNESTYTIVASTNRGWTTSVDGFTNFRVRLSTAITGTGTATVIIIPQAFAIEPMVTVGQSTASQLQAMTTSADSSTSGTIASVTSVTLPIQGMSSWSISFTGTMVGNLIFEGSIDGTQYFQLYVAAVSGTGVLNNAVNVLTSVTSGLYYIGSCTGLVSVRVRNSSYTSGSTVAAIRATAGAIPNLNPPQTALYTTDNYGNIVNTTSQFPIGISLPYVYNGSGGDRPRTATSGNGTTGTGVPAAGVLGFDGTNYRRLLTNTTGQLVTPAATTTGGATTFTLISAATTNATSVKASAGTVYGIQASNTGAAVAFLKVFNLATAPTVGTSVAVMTLIIPAGGGITVPIPPTGLAFGTGIAISITGLATTADTTAVALSQVVANLQYA